MRLHKYNSYAHYLSQQKQRYNYQERSHNPSLSEEAWVTDDELDAIAAQIRERSPDPTFGICHGVMNGKENRYLAEALGCAVVGTDIGETKWPGVIVWDFMKENGAWLEAADFWYSNALDHACEPTEAIVVWMRQLKPTGAGFLSWGKSHANPPGDADPFSAEFDEYLELVETAGFTVGAVLEPDWFDPARHDEEKETRRTIVVLP